MTTQIGAKNYTTDEYLSLEIASETRSEYRNGEIIPMTGGRLEHNRISGNLYIALSLRLKRKPYELPKLLQLQTGRKDTVIHTCFIAEILSK